MNAMPSLKDRAPWAVFGRNCGLSSWRHSTLSWCRRGRWLRHCCARGCSIPLLRPCAHAPSLAEPPYGHPTSTHSRHTLLKRFAARCLALRETPRRQARVPCPSDQPTCWWPSLRKDRARCSRLLYETTKVRVEEKEVKRKKRCNEMHLRMRTKAQPIWPLTERQGRVRLSNLLCLLRVSNMVIFPLPSPATTTSRFSGIGLMHVIPTVASSSGSESS